MFALINGFILVDDLFTINLVVQNINIIIEIAKFFLC